MKKNVVQSLVVAILIMLAPSINLSGQVRTPTLYVTGTVLSDEKMLVSVRGTKTIEGNVVTAELNGKKTEAKTDNKGQALLDFSAISAGLVGQGLAVIKSFDKNGNQLGTANTTVQNGTLGLARPVIQQLPKNIPTGEAVTIPGQNLGADAKLVCGDQYQETLSAADREMTVFTNAKPGETLLWVTTPNGVSESQMVNIYSLEFALAKNSIKPRENVLAQVHYESIPVGTKLIFTNKSPQTIKMTIPGAQNAANECIYTVAEQNGSLPVNITGIIRGDFKIALDYDFKNEKKDSIPPVFYDEKPLPPPNPKQPKDEAQPPAPEPPKTLADTLKIKDDVIKALDEIDKILNGRPSNGEDDRRSKTDGLIDYLNRSIAGEKRIYAAEEGILNDRRFSNLERNDAGGNLKKARENIEKALAEEKTALENKAKAANKLKEIKDKIRPNDLKGKINRAKNDEITADKLKNGTKTEQEKGALAQSDAEVIEKEVRRQLDVIIGLLRENKLLINAIDDARLRAIELKAQAQKNIDDYLKDDNTSKANKEKASDWADKLKKSREDLEKEADLLKTISEETTKAEKLNVEARDKLDKIIKK